MAEPGSVSATAGLRLQGRVAIVTGGGSGFGAGICAKFAAEGARVIVADQNLNAALDVVAGIGIAARALRVDVTQAADVRLMFDAAEHHFGGVDILVNAARAGRASPMPQTLEALPEDEFDRRHAVDMKTLFLALREGVPRFKARAKGPTGGVVLNITGAGPRRQQAWDAAGKAWMIAATGACAEELAISGIRVNALDAAGGPTPQDVAQVACYLCSDEASKITGACLKVGSLPGP